MKNKKLLTARQRRRGAGTKQHIYFITLGVNNQVPKVKTLGSPDMKASQAARRAGKMTMKDQQNIARRIKALCKLAGYDNYAQFAGALGMSERRIKYILTNPECISISEAVRIQKMADAYDHFKVFDTISVSDQA